MIEAVVVRPTPAPSLRLIAGGVTSRRPDRWWEHRARMRELVGGCPDHWWSTTAPRTGRCTCDRFDR